MDNHNLCPELLALKSAFESSSVPFLLLGSKLEAVFLNDSLINSYPEFKNPIFPALLFRNTDEQTVLNYLKSEKSYTLYLESADNEPRSVVLNAVFDKEQKVVGAFVIFAIRIMGKRQLTRLGYRYASA